MQVHWCVPHGWAAALDDSFDTPYCAAREPLRRRERALEPRADVQTRGCASRKVRTGKSAFPRMLRRRRVQRLALVVDGTSCGLRQKRRVELDIPTVFVPSSDDADVLRRNRSGSDQHQQFDDTAFVAALTEGICSALGLGGCDEGGAPLSLDVLDVEFDTWCVRLGCLWCHAAFPIRRRSAQCLLSFKTQSAVNVMCSPTLPRPPSRPRAPVDRHGPADVRPYVARVELTRRAQLAGGRGQIRIAPTATPATPATAAGATCVLPAHTEVSDDRAHLQRHGDAATPATAMAVPALPGEDEERDEDEDEDEGSATNRTNRARAAHGRDGLHLHGPRATPVAVPTVSTVPAWRLIYVAQA